MLIFRFIFVFWVSTICLHALLFKSQLIYVYLTVLAPVSLSSPPESAQSALISL